METITRNVAFDNMITTLQKEVIDWFHSTPKYQALGLWKAQVYNITSLYINPDMYRAIYLAVVDDVTLYVQDVLTDEGLL